MKYIFKRLLQMLVVLLLVSVFSFAIVYFSPGDPLYMYMNPSATGRKMTEAELNVLRESLGLTGGPVKQYLSWAEKILHGDWGISTNSRLDVLPQILEKLPNTAFLMGASLLLSLLLSIPLGLLAGTCENRLPDHIISSITYLGVSIPSFWMGIMLIIVFSLRLKLLPASGMQTVGVNSLADIFMHAILPAIVLSLNSTAILTRYIRANTISQLQENYVQTAVSNGFSAPRILFGQVLKNCMLPVITIVGSRLGTLVTGSFITETIFGWPGLGTLGVTAVNNRDYPMIMGITIFSSTFLLVGNFLADLCYSVLDPRIRLE